MTEYEYQNLNSNGQIQLSIGVRVIESFLVGRGRAGLGRGGEAEQMPISSAIDQKYEKTLPLSHS